MTCESASHVALVAGYDCDDDLLVTEYTYLGGWRETPLEEWLATRRTQVWFGIAPGNLRGAQAIGELPWAYGKLGYGFGEAVWAWVCRIIGRRWAGRGQICSTYVQRVWKAAKSANWMGDGRAMYPGDFFDYVISYPVTE
ncbi:MAG: hypothetical protein P1V51_20010 [Deltaproteobacteria bacterium]|nr:hypothetical protein [Deltaproteobacteria bacterium]